MQFIKPNEKSRNYKSYPFLKHGFALSGNKSSVLMIKEKRTPVLTPRNFLNIYFFKSVSIFLAIGKDV